jgi:hypothetical protein
MNSCLSEEILQTYLDGELAEDAVSSVLAHLAACAGCARRSAEAQQALCEISGKLDDHLPADIYVERLVARVETAVAAASTRTNPIPFFWRAGLVAASLLIAVGGLAWLFLTPPEPKQVTTVAQPEKPGGVTANSHGLAQSQAAPRPALGRKGGSARPKSKSLGLAGGSVPNLGPMPEPAAPVVSPQEGAYFFDIETTRHLEKTQVLLRSFENGSFSSGKELAYEQRVSRELLYRNIWLRREAEAAEHTPAKALLGSLEPLLLDIANLPAKPASGELRAVKQRIRKSAIVAALQVYAAPTASVE